MKKSGPDWVRDGVFYQIFPDRFAISERVPKPGALEPWDAPPTYHGFKGGDLLGIAERLDWLADLGVTAIYLNPIFSSASNHRYHTYDYDNVDPLLGGNEALRELLDEAHRRDVRVILDGVFNHASRGFWPFNHVLENGPASPYAGWFNLSPEVLAGKRGLTAYPGKREMSAMLQRRGGDRPGSASAAAFGYEAWWDLPALPKLNHKNPAVREYFMGIAEKWLRFGIDGWRLDVPTEISEPGFWEEFRERCLAVNPEAYIVGEIWNPAPDWLTGSRFHALMNYPLTEAVLSFVGGERLDFELVAQAWEYNRHVHPADGPETARWLDAVMKTYPLDVTEVQLNLLSSHDTPRFISLAGGDASAMRLASLIQMTLPGSPSIYYGDEVGVEGAHDPDCRRAYPWDPTRQDLALRGFIKGLISLRKSEPATRHGRFRVLGAEGWTLAYALDYDGEGSRAGEVAARVAPAEGASAEGAPVEPDSPLGSGSIVVAVNAGRSPARLRFALPGLAGARVEQVSWHGSDWETALTSGSLQEDWLEVDLRAREGIVLRAQQAR